MPSSPSSLHGCPDVMARIWVHVGLLVWATDNFTSTISDPCLFLLRVWESFSQALLFPSFSFEVVVRQHFSFLAISGHVVVAINWMVLWAQFGIFGPFVGACVVVAFNLAASCLSTLDSSIQLPPLMPAPIEPSRDIMIVIKSNAVSYNMDNHHTTLERKDTNTNLYKYKLMLSQVTQWTFWGILKRF